MQGLYINKGKGENSYAENSLFQVTLDKYSKNINIFTPMAFFEGLRGGYYEKPKKIISFGSSMVEAAIFNILLEVHPESMGIADLGCSSGPNSLAVVDKIIDMVGIGSRQIGQNVPELRVSLNDLPGNDFNNVFELLPELYKKARKDYGIEGCYVCGMPGSFYGKLFPSQSLHFVHSSSSIHWLSQKPKIESSHLDKEYIYISKGSSESFVKAHQHQFHEDFSLFLKSRAKEMVPRGRMVLTFMGRRSHDPRVDEGSDFWKPLAHALVSMVLDGLVKIEMLNSFNIPYYAPCLEEVECEVEKDGSFLIDNVEAFDIEWFDSDSSSLKDSRSNQAAKTIRALVEPLCGSHFHFDNEMMDELFRRHVKIFNNCFSETRFKSIVWVISFMKKG